MLDEKAYQRTFEHAMEHFRYNKGQSSELIGAAEDFYETARSALENGRLRPAIDNLFSASELAAKAYVITSPLPGDEDVKSHGKVHSRFNMFSQHGNIDSDQRKTFNALSSARASARYVRGEFPHTPAKVEEWRAHVECLIEHVKARIAT